MAEIMIPSPSCFLRTSPEPPHRDLQPQDSQKERKRSVSKKKKSSTPTTKIEGSAVTKPKQSKSRNGCVTCKAKRLKCDETKPTCQQCKRRSVECGGYKKDFKWRPFEETNVATNIAKQKKASPPATQPSSRHASPSASQVRESASPKAVLSKGKDGSRSPSQVSPRERPLSTSASFLQQTFPSASEHGRHGSHVSAESTPQLPPSESNKGKGVETPFSRVSPCVDPDVPNTSTSHVGSFDGGDGQFLAADPIASTDTDHAPMLLLEPDFMDFDTDNLDLLHDLNDMDDLDNFLLQDSPPDDVHIDDEYPDDIENIVRMPAATPDYDAWALRLASRPANARSGSTRRAGHDAFNGPFTYIFDQPSLHANSPEMLMMRFDRFTCGILSVKDGPNENPWRSLIWPMAQESPALYHAVSSMTAFHSSRDIPALRLTGHEHKDASVKNLLEGIEEGTMNIDTAIATTLALAFAECWDQHTSSGNSHIKGARTMINIALGQHKQSPLGGVNLARLKFLCNAWVYLDVIARITTVDEDESDDYDKLYCLYSTQPSVGPSPPGHGGFGIDFGMPIDAQLDPLMGCASTLFPLIGRVANLVRRVCREESNSPPMISQAMELKLLLETWDPPAFIEPPEDPTSNAEHSVQTAEAYRWATLLYLHQALPEIPGLSSAEMAKRVLCLLATVPLVSRCVIVHIYPLMMAGCEAKNKENRQWVRDRWAAMSQRMRIGPIEKCMDVTEEVWRRRDEYENQPMRKTLVSTADLLSARPNQSGRGMSFQGSLNARNGALGWADGFDSASSGGRRRGMEDPDVLGSRRASRCHRDSIHGTLDPMYTVKGTLHWVGVMKDWDWEVLLG